MRRYKIKSGRMFTVRYNGIQTLTKASYDVEYDGFPFHEGLKGPLLVAISNKIGDDQAIDLLLIDIQTRKLEQQGAKPYLREY